MAAGAAPLRVGAALPVTPPAYHDCYTTRTTRTTSTATTIAGSRCGTRGGCGEAVRRGRSTERVRVTVPPSFGTVRPVAGDWFPTLRGGSTGSHPRGSITGLRGPFNQTRFCYGCLPTTTTSTHDHMYITYKNHDCYDSAAVLTHMVSHTHRPPRVSWAWSVALCSLFCLISWSLYRFSLVFAEALALSSVDW